MSSSAAKTKVFISYSRRDREFVSRLIDALKEVEDIEVFRDTDDILPTEEWRGRLEHLIRTCDTIVFALSPDSATSSVCAWEVELAETLNKRIAPIVIRDVEGTDIPPSLSKLNYIFFTNDREFDRSIGNLVAALNTDIGWIREHTRLGTQARRWDMRSRPVLNLMRGNDLTAAEDWLASHPRNAPDPTELHHAFIQASRRAHTKRQRIVLGSSVAAAVVAVVLAGFAFVQQQAALRSEQLATAERDRAEAALRTATDGANRLVFGLAQKFKNAPVPGQIIKSILEEAHGLQEALSENFPDDPRLQQSEAAALVELGDIYTRIGNLGEASAAYEESLKLARVLAARDAANLQWQRDVSYSLSKIGDVRLYAGNARDALAAYEESLTIARAIAAKDPGKTQWQQDVAELLEALGDLHLYAADTQAALATLTESLDIRRTLVDIEPENEGWQRDVAVSLNKMGDVLRRTGDAKAALASYDRSLGIAGALAEANPDNTRFQRDVSYSHNKIGTLMLASGDNASALASFEASLRIARLLSNRDSENTQWRRDVAWVLEAIGEVRRDGGSPKAALIAYAESLKIRRALAERDRGNYRWQRDLAVSLTEAANLHRLDNEPEPARAALSEAVAIEEALVAHNPGNEKWQGDLAASLAALGEVQHGLADTEAASKSVTRALELQRKLAEAEPQNTQARIDLLEALVRVGRYAENADMRLSALEEARAIAADWAGDGPLAGAGEQWAEIVRAELARLPVRNASQ
ncbi:TIR domain-containing protein [Tepidamorphus sp. 3E244]|uniref:TIR domain-containing protein n=1 Tax=Tepidamorphus sp. 3E244 TaxID=3385498 RepID=UPI0038FC8588